MKRILLLTILASFLSLIVSCSSSGQLNQQPINTSPKNNIEFPKSIDSQSDSESATEAPKEKTSDVNTQNSENFVGKIPDSFYGNWAISKCLALPRVSEFDDKRIKAFIGSTINIQKDFIEQSNRCENPFYNVKEMTVNDFNDKWIDSFLLSSINNLWDNANETITEIKVFESKTDLMPWEYGYNTFYVKDSDTLIVWMGAFFELKRYTGDIATTEESQVSTLEFPEINPSSIISEFHPIVIANLFLGGYKDKKWINPLDLEDKISGSEKYYVYSKEKLLGKVDGVKLGYSQASGALKLNLFKDERDECYDKYFVGISADWDLLPRKPVKIKDMLQYNSFISDILKEKSVDAKPNIKAAYKIDLDNDNINEVVVEADNMQTLEELKKNQYSIIVIIKDIQGKMSCSLLKSFIYNSESKDNLALINSVYGFADVNGDGGLEIIIRSAYYEGESYIIYEHINENYEPVLRASNGA